MSAPIDIAATIAALCAPFPEEQISWRKGSKSKFDADKFIPLAYIDQRDVQKRLEAVMPGRWSCEHYAGPNNTVICKIGLLIDGAWVYRSDGGQDLTDSESLQEQENTAKGAFANAFKRAGVMWGIGRYLYDCKSGYVAFGKDNQPVEAEMKKLFAMLRRIGGGNVSTATTRSENVSTKPQNVDTSKLTTSEKARAAMVAARPVQPHDHDPQTGVVLDDTDPNTWKEDAPATPLPVERYPDMGEVIDDSIPHMATKESSEAARMLLEFALGELQPVPEDMAQYAADSKRLMANDMLPDDIAAIEAAQKDWKARVNALREAEKLKAEQGDQPAQKRNRSRRAAA